MNIPDYTSPIVAHRVWQWDDSGLKSLSQEPWFPCQPLAARCIQASDRHQAPQMACTCGIYAAKDLDQLRGMGYCQYGIHGEVYLWGTVVEHSFGWRAQFAYPKSLVLPPESLLFGRFVQREMKTEEVESHMAALTAYGADIFVATAKENIRLWTKHSGYDSAVLDCLGEGATWQLVVVPVAVLMEGRNPRVLVQNGLELVHSAEIVFTDAGFPLSPADPIVRQIQDRRARVVVIDINLENVQSALYLAKIISRIAGHVAVAVRGDLSNLTNLMVATLGAEDYMALARDSRYDILETFVCLSRARSKTSAPDRETTPPTAPVYAPVGKGPRPLRPREVALAI